MTLGIDPHSSFSVFLYICLLLWSIKIINVKKVAAATLKCNPFTAMLILLAAALSVGLIAQATALLRLIWTRMLRANSIG